MNRVILIGYVGVMPKLIHMGSGDELCVFSVGERDFRGKTEWHRVVLFGDQALLGKTRISKGDEIYIEGRLSSTKWTDKAGEKHHSYEIKCERFECLSGHSTQREDESIDCLDDLLKEIEP